MGGRVAALVLLLAAGCRHETAGAEEKAPPVRTRCVAAARAEIDETLLLRGRVAPPPGGDLPVAAQVAGRVVDVKVKEGDSIKKGALVAIVDDLAPRAAAKEADASLARAMSSEATARSTLERAKALAAAGVGSQADVEDAAAKHAAARAEVEAGKAQLRLAAGNLGRVEVRSAFGGVVTKLWRGAGALVDGTAATPIAQLASTDAIELVADVTQKELGAVKEGQRVKIALSGGVELAGAVIARSRALDASTGLGQIRVAIEASAEMPPLGAFGDAKIELGKRAVLAIPRAALRGAIADGAEVVVCKRDEKGTAAELRKVVAGYRDELRVEVTAGLTEGELVAVDHVLGVDDGTPLDAVQGEADAEKERPPAERP